MNKISIAVIGSGRIAETEHIPALLKSRDITLSAIVDHDRSRARDIIDKYGLDAAYASDLDMIDDHLDGAIICTPNDSHMGLCLQCFERGIHVLVEKPLASTYHDALSIQSKALEKQCEVMVGYCTRFWPGVQYLKQIIDSKALGRVQRFLLQYGNAGGWAPVSNYILSKEQSGGGAFLINGSHYLDRMIYYFGLPHSSRFFDDALAGLEANAVAEFGYDDDAGGFKGMIRASKTVNLNSGCFIEFEYGIVKHDDLKDPALSLVLKTGGEKVDILFGGHTAQRASRPDMYLLQINEFVQRINKSKSTNFISDFEDAVENVRITEELYRKREPMQCNWYHAR